METITEVVEKRMSNSLVLFMKLVDPDKIYKIDLELSKAWSRLTLVQQRRLYLYLLYRKWRGEGLYNTPYDIVKNCRPYPTNWNGRPLINRLMKETPMVRAKHNGEYGIYTRDEATVWGMTEIICLNFRNN